MTRAMKPQISSPSERKLVLNLDMLVLLWRRDPEAWERFKDAFIPIANSAADDLAEDLGPQSLTITVEVTQS